MKIIYSLLLLVSIGCTPVSKETKYAYELINEQSCYLKETENLSTYGIGASIPDQIHSLHINLSIEKKLSIDEIRKLFIRSVESFKDRINNNPIIRPYLLQYPVTHKNIELSISFKEKNGSRVLPPYVAYVFLCDDTIVYSFYDIKERMFSDDDYVEPYLEALEIVKNQPDRDVSPQVCDESTCFVPSFNPQTDGNNYQEVLEELGKQYIKRNQIR